VDLELWDIQGLSSDTFSPYRGEIMRIPAPPLHQDLREQVDALNGYAFQEFEIGVSGFFFSNFLYSLFHAIL
jgi:hypothetical protein